MADEETIKRRMQQAKGSVVEGTLQMAALYDGLDEDDAVLEMTARLVEGDPPKLLMAARTAMLAISWHRAKQTEAIVNSPAPGQ